VIGAAEELAGVFEALGVRYLLGGSMAAAVWGEPRFTRDVDMVAALASEHVAPFLAALGERWYADETMIRDAIQRCSSFNVIRNKRMVKVDIFVPPNIGLHAAKWSRARSIRLGPTSKRAVATTSAEDILLQKLVWFRDGGEVSELQWRDVVALARMLVGELDWEYIASWAAQLGVTPLLERARKDTTA
jgi:hypothetical protein